MVGVPTQSSTLSSDNKLEMCKKRTYRVLGFIVFATNVIACILIKEKFPRHKKGKKPLPLREVFNFTVLKDTNYIMWVIGSGIAFMGFFIPFFFLPGTSG